jgi:predicted dehydrogenase
MAAFRAAFYGSGGIAGKHASGLAGMEHVEIVGCVDVDESRAAAFAEKFGGTGYTDAEAMIGETSPDAVWVCVPPHCHGIELTLAEKKIPFIAEKPIHRDLAQAREIEAAVNENGIPAGAAYMNRFRAGVNRAKEIFSSDPPVIAYGGWLGGMPGVMWWRKRAESGGQLLEQTTHIFDVLRYIAGDAEEVFAYPARGFIKDVPEYDVDDASTVAIRMKSGAVANLMSCCALSTGGGVFLTLLGTDTAVRFSGWNQDAEIEPADGDAETIAGEGNIFEIEDSAFIKAVQAGGTEGFASPYSEGVKSLALGLAANESIETGKPVALD